MGFALKKKKKRVRKQNNLFLLKKKNTLDSHLLEKFIETVYE